MGDRPPHTTVDAYRTIPLLTGPENFQQWQESVDAFARCKNLIRIFKGTDTEPFRRPIPPHVAAGTPEYLSIRPSTDRAGDNPPIGALQTVTFPAAHGPALDDDDMAKWESWQARENPAHAAIMETISANLRSTIHNAWSAFDCLATLQSKFITTSGSHKRAAKAKEMRSHLETFRYYLHQSELVGVPWTDFDRSDVFLNSLPDDMTELIHLKWDTACVSVGREEDFEILMTTYSSFTEQRRLRWEASEGVAAAPGILKPARKNAEASGLGRRPNIYSRDSRPNAGCRTQTNNTPPDAVCTHCERPYHTKDACFEHDAGLPSASERRRRIAAACKAKSLTPRNLNSPPRPDMKNIAAATTDYTSDVTHRPCRGHNALNTDAVPNERSASWCSVSLVERVLRWGCGVK
ncbi:uncharacterized protein CcaverHIS019_0301490 [Cutaneotrichosporon cavernicola]|uniref:Uncharacterized protein n=1 Tax=Cutaneotrichosporon cavernicola TaxID=279322 RepID=A0AA48KZ49_9TREE|nr:uncharacterized protein CcaverHIS019_0301490 [Cutaneotrichosporon cavernicola]BEI90079.1 hypothetical protein CcaverHIS019_0301490 [Cutaneotrichosporon cavernicola]